PRAERVAELGREIEPPHELAGDSFQRDQRRAHAASSGWWQRNACAPGLVGSPVSAGSVPQTAVARAQRWRNAQPGGGSSREGGMPGIWASGTPLRLRLGTELSRPAV